MAEDHNILKLLIAERKPLSINKIAKIRDINYKSAYKAVMKLKDEGIIDMEKLGNTNLCRFNNSFNPAVFKAEYERREELNRDIRIIRQEMMKVPEQSIVLLFGSYVKNGKGKHSDIDLLIVSENPAEIERQISLIPLDIHPTTVSNRDFIASALSRQFNVVAEAMEQNIILVGIEDYYRLLANVKRKTDQGGGV